MLDSRPLDDLCCLTQATLLNTCLGAADLRRLGHWTEDTYERGLSPAAWNRATLHKACRRDPAVARRVTDLLDLAYLDTVGVVRCMDDLELRTLVELWVAHPDGEALPALLWALCSDARDSVSALGARLCHEATTRALQELVETTPALRRPAGDA